MRVFFIRHGQSAANLTQTYAGQTDVPLTQQGRDEAMQLRPVLGQIPFDRVYSSDLSRAMETQQLALPAHRAVTTPLLREYDVGSLVGMDFAEARRAYPQLVGSVRDFSPFGGESSADVSRRLQQFLDSLAADPCENAAVFAHNGLLVCMLRIALQAQIDASAVRSSNCAVHVFEYDAGRWKLLAWNYMNPLL